MINKRLMSLMQDSNRYIVGQVICQWGQLICQIIIMFILGDMIQGLAEGILIKHHELFQNILLIIGLIVIKSIMIMIQSQLSYKSSENVKLDLRKMIYEKMLRLNVEYPKHVTTASLTQLMVEGVDQLEIYFGKYLPQFFYSMLAPLTLFVILVGIEMKTAMVLLLCVPLIPVSIIAVQKFAKKLLGKYWGMYGNLAERFLDNIRGLTTLKIYQSDDVKHLQMNEEAEKFRKITMRVLIMQLNSISIMDLVAYGGAVAGIILTLLSLKNGQIKAGDAFVLMMLSAEFFIPLRQLGSFFHIAMNGNAAADKIFKFLDVEENNKVYDAFLPEDASICLEKVSFSYDQKKKVLQDISLKLDKDNCIGIVGESGSGKSTLAALISGYYSDYEGVIQLGKKDMSLISHQDVTQYISVVDHQAFLFKGTVRDNLLVANETATDEQMWEALEKVELAEFIQSQKGLDTFINEKGSNISGGQAQRLSLARALLKNASVYLFDEATSNIDVESENAIMKVIHELSQTHKVIMITHRLANVMNFDCIYVLDHGKLAGAGQHDELMRKCPVYASMVQTQNEIETIVGGECHA